MPLSRCSILVIYLLLFSLYGKSAAAIQVWRSYADGTLKIIAGTFNLVDTIPTGSGVQLLPVRRTSAGDPANIERRYLYMVVKSGRIQSRRIKNHDTNPFHICDYGVLR
jgi:hypothetical protein